MGFLVLLLIVWSSGTPGDAHSLSYNFNIDPQPRPGQPWCEVQGQVDGEVFLSYDCGHAKIIFTSPLGEEVKTTKAWETQIETLRDIRDQLCDFTLEKPMVTGNLESPSTGGGDWGLKAQLDIGPSLVVQWKEQLLHERPGSDQLVPGDVDPGEMDPGGAENLSSPEAELFLSHGGSRPSHPAGQDDMSL